METDQRHDIAPAGTRNDHVLHVETGDNYVDAAETWSEDLRTADELVLPVETDMSDDHSAGTWTDTATTSLDVADDDELVAANDAPYVGDWHAASDAREEALRRHSSWLGRLDVSVTWRAGWSATGERRDEVLLVGTWRL